MSRIDILCNDGSPLNVTLNSIYGKDGRMGVGGAELALLTMCEAWHKDNHEVTLYNNPNNPEVGPFRQLALNDFKPEDDRDILIIFRSPNSRIKDAKGLRVWWSTDQRTVGDFRAFSKAVDRIVTISHFHSEYFKNMYGITNTVSIDLPVRTWEYRDKIAKVPNRCIFTSIPDRGLMPLNAAWPLILREVPDASLVITSDWRLWSSDMDDSPVRPYRLAFSHQPNVNYLGAVNRTRLIQEQLAAQLHIYPSIYDELFCIAVAESQVAGALPVTSNYGALGSTNMGMVIHGNPTDPRWIEVFVQQVVSLLKDPKLPERQAHIQALAEKRFSITRILKEWEEKVFA